MEVLWLVFFLLLVILEGVYLACGGGPIGISKNRSHVLKGSLGASWWPTTTTRPLLAGLGDQAAWVVSLGSL